MKNAPYLYGQLNFFRTMGMSNFWFYFIMVVVILHFVVGFGYLIYKLSPRKSDKKKNESEEADNNAL